MAEEETSGFTVTDRRTASQASVEAETGVSPEQSAAPEQSEAQEEEQTAREAPRADPAMLLAMAAMQIDAGTLAHVMMGVFDGKAWQAMGLVADPLTGEAKIDLKAAHLAIDSVQFFLGKVEDDLTSEEKRDARRRLNDLRMNFLSKSTGQ
ncbi:MAG TPA: DUF1844 domain-containing protein [Chthonomonadales bacterium]|nr:DUF1844 domain-containing protein [Chthonomonadales bacterium]